jgi:FkbM family methyltransferase
MSPALSLVRRAAEMPGLRRLTGITPLLRVSFALRASLVVQSLRFALNELRGRDTVQVYTPRNSKIAIALRHHSPDVLVLDELFSQEEYAFPDAVVAALRETASPQVVDLGANIGLFGALVLNAFPRARVLSVEVDPGNAAVHEAAIAANAGSDWTLIRGAAGTAAGRAAYVLGHYATSRAAHPHELASDVEVIDVLPLLAEADFVKIDIEGGEWAILDDPRFRQGRARAIVLEYHSHLCPEEDPGEAAKRRLEAAQYSLKVGATKPRFGVGLLWGLRREGGEA